MLATTKKDFYVFVWPFFTCSFYWCNNMCILHVNLMNFHTLWHRAFQHIVYALFKHITVHSSLQNMSKSPHPETFCKNNSCGTAFTSPLKNTNKTQLVDIRTNSTAASGDNCVRGLTRRNLPWHKTQNCRCIHVETRIYFHCIHVETTDKTGNKRKDTCPGYHYSHVNVSQSRRRQTHINSSDYRASKRK